MNEEDRRVVRTRRLLKNALLDLMEEGNYETITIRRITDQADIGYATFFRHYDGKDELMLELFTDIITELEAMPEGHGGQYFEQEGYLLFEHVAQNQALYRGILDSPTFARKFRDLLKDIVRGHLESHAEVISSPALPFEIAAQHMVASHLGLIDWWLSNDRPYSIEIMARIYDRLIIRATWQALQMENELILPWEKLDE
jgi:AcrR family transcriptional regulator